MSTNFWQIPAPLTGTPKNNCWDNFRINSGFGSRELERGWSYWGVLRMQLLASTCLHHCSGGPHCRESCPPSLMSVIRNSSHTRAAQGHSFVLHACAQPSDFSGVSCLGCAMRWCGSCSKWTRALICSSKCPLENASWLLRPLGPSDPSKHLMSCLLVVADLWWLSPIGQLPAGVMNLLVLWSCHSKTLHCLASFLRSQWDTHFCCIIELHVSG